MSVSKGLREGLGDYFGYPFPARVGTIYRTPGGAWRVHDPQSLLAEASLIRVLIHRLVHLSGSEELPLSPNMIEVGGPRNNDDSAVWMVAECPDHCMSRRPVEQWVGFAAHVLLGALDAYPPGSEPRGFRISEQRSIRSYALEAVRATLEAGIGEATSRYQVDHDGLLEFLRLARRLSTQREEGHHVRGQIVYLDQGSIPDSAIHLALRLGERLPDVLNVKHVGKLLAGAQQGCAMAIRGRQVLGYGANISRVPGSVTLEFEGRYGLIRQADHPVGLVRDGSFLGCGYEIPASKLIEDHLRSQGLRTGGASGITNLIRSAHGHGATVIVDVSGAGASLPGHTPEVPLRLSGRGSERGLALAARLAGIDGALVVTPRGTMVKFAALLDGISTGAENLARGARYNTALRYSTSHPQDLLIVVSSDGPTTVFAQGKVIYPVDPPNPGVPDPPPADPVFDDWVRDHGTPLEQRFLRERQRLAAMGDFERLLHEEGPRRRRTKRKGPRPAKGR